MNGEAPRPKPKPQKQNKKALAAKLERLNRELVFWLYPECVEKASDGANCGGGWELGHIIRRSDSAWLKLLWWNQVKQCFNHNHYHGDPQLHTVMGEKYMARLRAEFMAHRRDKVTPEVLRERIEKVQRLWDNRPAVYTVKTLLAKGYYG